MRPDIQTLIIGIVHSNANVNDYTVSHICMYDVALVGVFSYKAHVDTNNSIDLHSDDIFFRLLHHSLII